MCVLFDLLHQNICATICVVFLEFWSYSLLMVTIRKTFKYRLYSNRRNKHLHRQIDVAGIIWVRPVRSKPTLAKSVREDEREGCGL